MNQSNQPKISDKLTTTDFQIILEEVTKIAVLETRLEKLLQDRPNITIAIQSDIFTNISQIISKFSQFTQTK